jgi:hypothetical protein
MTIEAERRPPAETGAKPAPPGNRLVSMLKFTVIAMAVLIVAGLGAVIWRIIALANDPSGHAAAVAKTPPAAISSQTPAQTLAQTQASDITLALPEGAVVRSTSLSGDRLAVHFETPTGPGIAIIDLPSGRTVSRVRLAPGGTRP